MSVESVDSVSLTVSQRNRNKSSKGKDPDFVYNWTDNSTDSEVRSRAASWSSNGGAAVVELRLKVRRKGKIPQNVVQEDRVSQPQLRQQRIDLLFKGNDIRRTNTLPDLRIDKDEGVVYNINNLNKDKEEGVIATSEETPAAQTVALGVNSVSEVSSSDGTFLSSYGSDYDTFVATEISTIERR